MPMHIADPASRVTQYCREFFECLEAVGCDSFLTKNPKKTVKLLISQLYPKKLKTEMKRRLDYNENLKYDVRGFIRRLKEQAQGCHKYDSASQPPYQPTPRTTHNQNRSYNENDQVSEIPVCLWEPHNKRGIRHLLKDCKQCTAENKNQIFDEIRKQMRDPLAHQTLRSNRHQKTA